MCDKIRSSNCVSISYMSACSLARLFVVYVDRASGGQAAVNDTITMIDEAMELVRSSFPPVPVEKLLWPADSQELADAMNVHKA